MEKARSHKWIEPNLKTGRLPGGDLCVLGQLFSFLYLVAGNQLKNRLIPRSDLSNAKYLSKSVDYSR